MEVFSIGLNVRGTIRHIIETRCPENPQFRYRLGPITQRKASNEMANFSITLTDLQGFDFTIDSPEDGAGNPVPFGGPLTVTASDDSALIVTSGADPNSFSVDTAAVAGKLGDFQLTVTDTVITDTIDVTVIGSTEASFGITLGTPRDRPVVVPAP